MLFIFILATSNFFGPVVFDIDSLETPLPTLSKQRTRKIVEFNLMFNACTTG